MALNTDRRTVDLSAFPELVVIYLGMRVNELRGLKTLLSFGPKISKSVAEQPDGLLLHAAWAAWVLARRTGTLSAGVRVLIVLAASVGIGSILWHTYPTPLTLILDIVPILIFIIWFT